MGLFPKRVGVSCFAAPTGDFRVSPDAPPTASSSSCKASSPISSPAMFPSVLWAFTSTGKSSSPLISAEDFSVTSTYHRRRCLTDRPETRVCVFDAATPRRAAWCCSCSRIRRTATPRPPPAAPLLQSDTLTAVFSEFREFEASPPPPPPSSSAAVAAASAFAARDPPRAFKSRDRKSAVWHPTPRRCCVSLLKVSSWSSEFTPPANTSPTGMR